jgi:hypothetical protein
MTGGGEQGSSSSAAANPAPPRWTAGRVIGLVFASIGGLIGLALLIGGIAVIAAFAFGRDDDGYFNTDRKQLRSATYAITAEDIDLGADEVDWAPNGILGKVRVQVEGKRPVFVGIGPDADVDRYLGDVARDQLADFHGHNPELDLHRGRERPRPPGKQGFWVAQSEGSGERAVRWDAEFGRWTVVVMNADASRGINVEADAGVKLGWAIWVGLGMLVIGLLMTAGAVIVIVLMSRHRGRDPATG